MSGQAITVDDVLTMLDIMVTRGEYSDQEAKDALLDAKARIEAHVASTADRHTEEFCARCAQVVSVTWRFGRWVMADEVRGGSWFKDAGHNAKCGSPCLRPGVSLIGDLRVHNSMRTCSLCKAMP